MPEVNVSKDALAKVKTALNEYNIDISGFSVRIEQQSDEISKSAYIETQKIARQVEDTVDKINQLKAQINQFAEEISKMSNEASLAKKTREDLQNQLGMRQVEADRIIELIANLEKNAAKAEDKEKENIQAQINQCMNQLSQIRAEISRLQNETAKLQLRALQLQRKINENRTEKSKKEDELRVAERLQDRLRNKQERMNIALGKVKDSVSTMLSASKSFETRAISKTEQNVGNIDKCIAAIDAYLA